MLNNEQFHKRIWERRNSSKLLKEEAIKTLIRNYWPPLCVAKVLNMPEYQVINFLIGNNETT